MAKAQPPAPPAESVESIAIRAAREADEYAALRVEIAVLEERRKELEARLKRDMVAAERKRFTTAHGLVSYTAGGEPKAVADLDAAVALLDARGLPQPTSMEDWLKQHGLQMPMKVKPGVPEKIEFRRA
jgi:hypothetical protein